MVFWSPREPRRTLRTAESETAWVRGALFSVSDEEEQLCGRFKAALRQRNRLVGTVKAEHSRAFYSSPALPWAGGARFTAPNVPVYNRRRPWNEGSPKRKTALPKAS